jgi:hypothetical protein
MIFITSVFPPAPHAPIAIGLTADRVRAQGRREFFGAGTPKHSQRPPPQATIIAEPKQPLLLRNDLE